MPEVNYRGIGWVEAEWRQEAELALWPIGLDLQGEGQREAPIETGRMRESFLTEVINDIDGTWVIVSVNVPYAEPQHEGFWKTGPLAGVQILNHPRGGKDHFLSDPMKRKSQLYLNWLADRLDRRFS